MGWLLNGTNAGGISEEYLSPRSNSLCFPSNSLDALCERFFGRNVFFIWCRHHSIECKEEVREGCWAIAVSTEARGKTKFNRPIVKVTSPVFECLTWRKTDRAGTADGLLYFLINPIDGALKRNSDMHESVH